MNPLLALNGLLVILFGDYAWHCLAIWRLARAGKPLPIRMTQAELAFRSFVVALMVFVLVITPFFRTAFPGSPAFVVATLYGIALAGGLYLAISWRWPAK